jgi:phosphoglycolate phosphatase-like HAD superfamily hydrolase
MKAARLAGMQAVGVLCGFGREKELRRAGADVILPATTDLLQIIFSHEK